jgi:hypothetical protein
MQLKCLFGRKDENSVNIKMHPKIAVFTTKTGQLSLEGLYKIFVLLSGRNFRENIIFSPESISSISKNISHFCP